MRIKRYVTSMRMADRGGAKGGRDAGYGVTDTFTMAVVQQHWKPPPPTPE
jgi:hypothetical protein